MWDLEGVSLEDIRRSLGDSQQSFDLPDCFVVSDDVGGRTYHAYSFPRLQLGQYLRILASTDYVDPLFLRYTASRGYATMRVSRKAGRGPFEVLAYLPSSVPYVIPDTFQVVRYDTGVEKRGLTLDVGGR